MELLLKYNFKLPPEEQVIKRNRTITTYYAQLYQHNPQLYKWAGMAAFASFHIGEKLTLWNWAHSGIKPLSHTCKKKNRTIEDDFQVIRIINNKIFLEIGWVHLAFEQMEFQVFKDHLLKSNKHPIIIDAFEELNNARNQLAVNGYSAAVNELIWKANTNILWHEQSKVVQPLFDKLSGLFSRAMTFFASFDYKINHHQTRRITRSKFIFFMLFYGFCQLKENWFIPEVTNLQHRWFWISNDLLKKWRIVEASKDLIHTEIKFLAKMENNILEM